MADLFEIIATAIHRDSKQCVLGLDECLGEGTCARAADAVVIALRSAGYTIMVPITPEEEARDGEYSW